MMNSDHTVFATPPTSLLRKRSPKTHHRHMNQAKKTKNSNIASRNDPLLSNTVGALLGIAADGVGGLPTETFLRPPFDRLRVRSASSARDGIRPPAARLLGSRRGG